MKETESYLTSGNLAITDLTADGRGIGHWAEPPYRGMTTFVKGGLPGDQVRVEIEKKRKTLLEGRATEVLTPSSERRTPPCPYADLCDGCPLMAWEPEAQRRWKLENVKQLFRRLGGFSAQEIPSASFSYDREEGYRNKVNLRLTPEGYLGYSHQKTHDVIRIDSCWIAHPEMQRLIRVWNEEANTADWAEVMRPIRMVILRAGATETMMVLVTDPLSEKTRAGIFDRLLPLGMTVLCQSENQRPGDVRVRKPIHYATSRHGMHQTLPLFDTDFPFVLSPASFFQVNRYLTPTLYEMALSAFSDLSHKRVLDLYCGTGTTSLLLAKGARSVVDVEVVADAVEDARNNAKANNASNLTFLRARAEEVIESLTASGLENRGEIKNPWDREEPVTSVLVDPPRQGLDEKVRQAIVRSSIRELVYISCNPATLARDGKEFREAGFSIDSMHLVDMFPNTAHVETVVLMSRVER